MTDEIDWDEILKRSDEFAREILEQDGTTVYGVPLPSELIKKMTAKDFTPKSCYE